MNNILQKLGLKDGESIDHPWINKALESGSTKVEARNFDIEKPLLNLTMFLMTKDKLSFLKENSNER